MQVTLNNIQLQSYRKQSKYCINHITVRDNMDL
jgi:hypothetical protein